MELGKARSTEEIIYPADSRIKSTLETKVNYIM